jgi:hypothetical protein
VTQQKGANDMNTIYRGYDIEQDIDGSFQWEEKTGTQHAGFATEEAAMDAIDSYKRRQQPCKEQAS